MLGRLLINEQQTDFRILEMMPQELMFYFLYWLVSSALCSVFSTYNLRFVHFCC